MSIKVSEITGMKIYNKETGEYFDFDGEIHDISVSSDVECAVAERAVHINKPSEMAITLITKTAFALCAALVGDECPNKTIIHHMKHGSLRVRKKNYHRMLKTMIKEWRDKYEDIG